MWGCAHGAILLPVGRASVMETAQSATHESESAVIAERKRSIALALRLGRHVRIGFGNPEEARGRFFKPCAICDRNAPARAGNETCCLKGVQS